MYLLNLLLQNNRIRYALNKTSVLQTEPSVQFHMLLLYVQLFYFIYKWNHYMDFWTYWIIKIFESRIKWIIKSSYGWTLILQLPHLLKWIFAVELRSLNLVIRIQMSCTKMDSTSKVVFFPWHLISFSFCENHLKWAYWVP